MGISWPVQEERKRQRKRFPGVVGNREGLLSGATYRSAHSVTVRPSIRPETLVYGDLSF